MKITSEWARDILAVFRGKKEMSHDSVVTEVKKLRRAEGRSWTKNSPSTIRCTMQRHCRTSEWYKGGPDLFEMVVRGTWKRRNK